MPQTVLSLVSKLSEEFAADRKLRQRRRHLDPADFKRLRETGFPLLAVPQSSGGYWSGPKNSTRLVSEILRVLASGDPSVALVAAMHPSVLAFWGASPIASPKYQAAWDAQQRVVFESARDGAWWGTITSEPGSGGDVARTRTAATPRDGEYVISGLKHFGSGSGIVDYVLTSAAPAGETFPDWFFLKVNGTPWDGSQGMTLLAEWDGAGMAATQSHAFRFDEYPAARFAWPGELLRIQQAAGGAVGCYFAAVILGVADAAMAEARAQIARRAGDLRAYEQVEWARAETDYWLICQAFEGMVRSVEADGGTPLGVRCGKIAIAELVEQMLSRICKVLGGGTFSRQSPFSYWYEDVRALGFLRPPWGLAFDALFQAVKPAGG